MQIRQSDLASFAYCAQQIKLTKQMAEQGYQRPVLSATARGSVLHFAFQTLQKLRHEGREDALAVALATFEHYWDPNHIQEVTEGPVEIWIGHDTWGGLLARSLDSLRAADRWLQTEKSVLLGLEHSFDVPIVIDGEEHTLHGTVDRLNLRMVNARPVIGIDDLKGYRQQKFGLDWATQWTLYSFASLQPEFWEPFYTDDAIVEGFAEVVDRIDKRGMAIHESPSRGDKPLLPRRGRLFWAWNGFVVQDVGWRTDAHYARLRAHLREYIGAVRAGVYPLNVDAHICTFCPFSKGICGGEPLPARQEGIK